MKVIDDMCEDEKRINDLIYYFRVKFKELGKGRHRICFTSTTRQFVFKVPSCLAGIAANDWEGSIFSEEYARHKLFYIDGIPIVIMEKVRILEGDELKNAYQNYDWVSSIDGGQVGMNRKGEIVAYDFACM